LAHRKRTVSADYGFQRATAARSVAGGKKLPWLVYRFCSTNRRIYRITPPQRLVPLLGGNRRCQQATKNPQSYELGVRNQGASTTSVYSRGRSHPEETEKLALLNSGMILPLGPPILLSLRHKSTNAMPDGDFGLPLGGQNLTACGTSPCEGEVDSHAGEPVFPNLTGFRFLSWVRRGEVLQPVKRPRSLLETF